MMRKLFLILIFSIAIGLYAQTEYVNIFHFNDLHGRIEKLPRIKFMIDSIENVNKGYSLVLFAGDMFSGKPYVDKCEKPGYPAIELLNEIPVNAATIGNHEFDYGLSALNQRIAEANFPFVVCNIYNGDSSLKNVKEYTEFKTTRGNRIVVLGITQVSKNGIPETHPDKVKGLKFSGGHEKAKQYSKLPGKKGVLIILSHMGYKNDTLMSSQLPNASLIIGAHSHTKMEKPYKGKYSEVVQAGNYGKYLGYFRLKIKKGKIISEEYKLLPVEDNRCEDQKLRKKADVYINNPAFDKEIAVLKTPLSGSVQLATMMAYSYLNECGSDLAVQNQGGVRINEIPPGPLTIKKVYELDPFDNPLLIVEMTPEEIKELIIQSIRLQGDYDLAPAGFSYEIVKSDKGTLSDIKLDFLNTMPNKSGKFRMAINSYIFFSYLKDTKIPYTETGMFSTQVLMTYIQKKGLENPVKVHIPEGNKGKY